MMSGNIHAPYYTANFFTLDAVTTGISSFELHFCNQFCHCVIKTKGRYFVGSVMQEDSVKYTLSIFPDLFADD